MDSHGSSNRKFHSYFNCTIPSVSGRLALCTCFKPFNSNNPDEQQFFPVTSASCHAVAANHANTVGNVTTVPVQLKLEQKEQAAAQFSTSVEQKPNATFDEGVKKAIRAEHNR